MIDTIILRIKNLSKYEKIYQQYYAPAMGKNSVSTAYVDMDTGEITEHSKISAAVYHDTGRVLPLTYRANINLPSSHYSVSYFINTSRDFLEFNFSIPKYIFGLNVLQFLDILDPDSKNCFIKLKQFLLKFIKESFIESPLLEDVEINRIDLCYNQIFNNKIDAFAYLDEQKKLLVTYARSSKNNYRSYDTSLMYITKRYSFKIYHKGTEFKKNDVKHLVGKNPFNYNLEEFQNKSDCILRYEMTFRKSMLDYLMKQYFFNSITRAEMPEILEHSMSKFAKKLISYSSIKYRVKQSPYEMWLKREKFFTLRSPFDYSKNENLLFDSEIVSFDYTIFKIIWNEFYKKILQFRVEKMLHVSDILQKIESYNETVKITNSFRKKQAFGKDSYRLISAALLSQYMSIDEMKPLMSKASFYRLKADLKKIGINTKMFDISFAQPRLDYVDYRILFGKFHYNELYF